MTKQTSRQTSKQGQSTNKQSSNQNSKQTNPANKQIASSSTKQSNSATKQPTRQAMKQDRRQEERQRQLNAKRRATRNKRILIGSLIAAAVLIVATVSYIVYSNTHNVSAQNQATPTEQVVNSAYPPVDGIYCDALEQTAYHIHAHLTIYINGKQVAIPQGIGIASDQSCLYWLHTHATNGVIHIEAPKKVSPTLGNFLDVWGQSFHQSGFQNELALSAGWTVYVDGKQVTSNFNQLVLQPHQVITIAYNSPGITPDTSYNWQPGE
jgi:hypothetical protein